MATETNIWLYGTILSSVGLEEGSFVQNSNIIKFPANSYRVIFAFCSEDVIMFFPPTSPFYTTKAIAVITEL